MIELARHIEVLLLDNDCVIVPGFGGFVSHRVPSRRVEEENLFLPPYRTIGFNPSMKLNDGLLVQSYMVAYDASYPEAVRLVESKVNYLENILQSEGEYELHGIGTLRQNIQGNYTFQPQEAGILSPDFYGMSSFEMLTLEEIAKKESEEKTAREAAIAAAKKKEPVLEPSFINETEKVIDMRARKRERYINLVAACIALLFVVLLALPFTNIGKTGSEMKRQSMSETVTEDCRSLINKIFDAIRVDSSTPKATGVKTTVSETKAIKKAPAKPAVKKEDTLAVKVETQPAAPEHFYTLVLASQVSKKNAQMFIERLSKREDIQAEILEGKFVSVIYSHFKTQGEAYQALNDLKHIPEFKQAWVKEIK